MESTAEVLEKIREEFKKAAEKREPHPLQQVVPQSATETISIKHPDAWHKRLFGLVCESYGLRQFRRPIESERIGNVQTFRPFFDKVLWPTFMEHTAIIENYLKMLMDEVLHEIFPDSDELTIGMK